MNEKRPDGEFIGELCSVCGELIGKGFGAEVTSTGTPSYGEWIHLDCVPKRFKCPATGLNCFDKPEPEKCCRKCPSATPAANDSDEDIADRVYLTGKDEDDE